MVRPLRIEWPGALYHITDRGNERKPIFRDDTDRRRLIKYLAEAVDRFHLRIHAVCLMPNHYHAEIETPRGNLSKTMQWLKTAYTVYFNRRHQRSGHLFQGRYKAAIVEKESHLMALTRYIHLNPVRAGLVVRPEDYGWSSYLEYIRVHQRWKWLETEWTLEQFGGINSKGRFRFRQFVEEGIEQELRDPLSKSIKGVILGGDQFIEWVQERFLNYRDDPPSVSASKLIGKIAITELIRNVSEVIDVPEHIIRDKGKHGNEARELAIFLAHKHSGETNVMIGKEFGEITGPTMTYLLCKIRDRLRQDRTFVKYVMWVEENLISKG